MFNYFIYTILKAISRFLLKRFVNKQDESVFISQLPVTDATLALEALEKEVNHFILHVIEYSLNSFSINESINTHLPNHKNFSKKTVTEKYNYIKQLHGEMHGFCLKLQHNTTDKTESERIEQLISSIRNGMYAAKNIRDAQSDIAQMINSSNDVKYNFYQQAASRIIRFYQYIFTLLNKQKATTNLNDLSLAYNEVIQGYSKTLQSLYKEPLIHKINEIEISTLINFNREIYTSYKSILFSLKDYLLTHKEAEYFDGLPGFIR
ncbi:MAG: hypothetical protein IPP48_11145 [Chitinophagaceae bacterium]|nr:hypothetical protein [Chitinophagaceae bacterium]